MWKTKKIKMLKSIQTKLKRKRYIDILQQKQRTIFLNSEVEWLMLETILKTSMKT